MATDDLAEQVRSLAKEHEHCMATIESARKRALAIELELSIVKVAIEKVDFSATKLQRRSAPTDKEVETLLNAVEMRRAT